MRICKFGQVKQIYDPKNSQVSSSNQYLFKNLTGRKYKVHKIIKSNVILGFSDPAKSHLTLVIALGMPYHIKLGHLFR